MKKTLKLQLEHVKQLTQSETARIQGGLPADPPETDESDTGGGYYSRANGFSYRVSNGHVTTNT